jgi:hypothetical protein
MSTHYYPYIGDLEELEQAPCGTWLGENSEFTGEWGWVTCGRCIRSKERLIVAIEADEREIVKQMGEMAEFMERDN